MALHSGVVSLLIVCAVVTLVGIRKANGENATSSCENMAVTFAPEDDFVIIWKERLATRLNLRCGNHTVDVFCVTVWVENTKIAKVYNPDQPGVRSTYNSTDTITFQGVYLGRTKIHFEFVLNSPCSNQQQHSGGNSTRTPGSDSESDSTTLSSLVKDVAVINKETLLYKIFIAVVILLVLVISVGFGSRIDMTYIIEIMKRPASLIVGLTCQLILLPLVSPLIYHSDK